VTEPHFLALMDKKQKDARAAGSSSTGTGTASSAGSDASVSDAQDGSEPRYRGGRNQILITVALLYPDAEFQVRCSGFCSERTLTVSSLHHQSATMLWNIFRLL
jgi:hypothetical protein